MEKKKEFIKLTLEVVIRKDKFFKMSKKEIMQLYKEEGFFWDEELKLKKVEFITKEENE